MPKRISIYVLILVSVGVFLNHFSVTQKENGLLLVIDGREVDAIGMVQDRWVKLTRQCERVTTIDSNAKLYLDIQQTIQTYSPPSSESAQVLSLRSTGEWSLAQVQFKDLLPAVVLIQQFEGKPSIVPNAIWSGETHPWLAAPYIRQYISSKAPQSPKALIECFDPV
jgi:hypothetical protein